jgi:hypothetical protein
MTILYTTPASILSTLGLAPEDLEPDYFLSSELPRLLRIDLYDWIPDHATLIVDILTASATDVNKYDLLIAYCTYFCASRVALAAYAFKSKETDGTNAYERSTIDFLKVAGEVQNKANLYKEKLLVIIRPVDVVVRVVQSTFVSPTTDPITGA